MNAKYVLIALVFIVMLAMPVLAESSNVDQNAKSVVVGHDNKVNTQNINAGTYVQHAIYKAYDNGIYTQNIYEVQGGNGIAMLDTGVIEFDRVVMADQVLKIDLIPNATTYFITSGTPVAVYTIGHLDKDAIQSSESILKYNPVYDRMDSGIVVPVDLVKYFTTKCSITPSANADYLVIDNRYYPQDTIVQILIP